MSDLGLGYEGQLKSPATWICILRKAVLQKEQSGLQIADNIGPLVSSMITDTKRLFFKSNKHWREGILEFVGLVTHMISTSISSTDKRVVNTLLSYEGLLKSIVQWGVWGKEYRPDIEKMISVEECGQISYLARECTVQLMNDAYQRGEDGRDRLVAIGSTPLVNKEYDPNFTTSFVVGLTDGLIGAVKVEGWNGDSVGNRLNTILLLINQADCVDKGVIKAMIEVGLNYANASGRCNSDKSLANSLLSMLLDKSSMHPSDTRVAFAIRAGFIEMCLDFIRRFGSRGAVHADAQNVFNQYIEQSIRNIHNIMSHQKTAKAIRSKKSMLEEKLVRLEQSSDIANNAQSKQSVKFVRSILSFNGTYCCRCDKSLSRTEAMECNGCHRMTYCSKACQKEDWLNGHKLACCKAYTDENVGQFQGTVSPTTRPQK